MQHRHVCHLGEQLQKIPFRMLGRYQLLTLVTVVTGLLYNQVFARLKTMNDEPLNCFLRYAASVTEWASAMLFKSLLSEIDSRQCTIDSRQCTNAVCLSTQCVSHSGLIFFLNDSVAISVMDCFSFC